MSILFWRGSLVTFIVKVTRQPSFGRSFSRLLGYIQTCILFLHLIHLHPCCFLIGCYYYGIFFQLEWLHFIFKILVAFLLALPIGWNRERQTRTMGIRTFPLVALGSTAYVLISLAVLRDDLDAQARIIQGLITGIGFVGGGAILKNPAGSVHGTATAVSVWTTGATISQ